MPLTVAWTCSVAEVEVEETTKRVAVFSRSSSVLPTAYHPRLIGNWWLLIE